MDWIVNFLTWVLENGFNLFVIIMWLIFGAIFSEGIRRTIRKVTKGRFFGAVPAATPKAK